MAENIEERKQLYRSGVDRYISGVCGGLAEYFNIDSNLIRIIFVILAFFGGIGIILYIAALIIVPENPHQETVTRRSKDNTFFWAILFIVIGLILLFRELGVFYYFNLWDIPWSVIWAVFLIGMGLVLIFSQSRRTPAVSSDEEAEAQIPEEDTGLKIYRSRDDRMLAGVCGGLAKYFHTDSSIVRLAWVLASLASIGLGILVYILLVIIFPEEPLEKTA